MRRSARSIPIFLADSRSQSSGVLSARSLSIYHRISVGLPVLLSLMTTRIPRYVAKWFPVGMPVCHSTLLIDIREFAADAVCGLALTHNFLTISWAFRSEVGCPAVDSGLSRMALR